MESRNNVCTDCSEDRSDTIAELQEDLASVKQSVQKLRNEVNTWVCLIALFLGALLLSAQTILLTGNGKVNALCHIVIESFFVKINTLYYTSVLYRGHTYIHVFICVYILIYVCIYIHKCIHAGIQTLR